MDAATRGRAEADGAYVHPLLRFERSAESGAGLAAAGPIGQGVRLLSVPVGMALRSAALPPARRAAVDAVLGPADGQGRLVLGLALSWLDGGGFMRQPSGGFDQMPLSWPDRTALGGSAFLARLEEEQARRGAEWRAVRAVLPEVSLELYMEACLTVQTRALDWSGRPELGWVLCPWVDLANHGYGWPHSNAAVELGDDDTIQLVSQLPIATDSKVLICYDGDADLLDLVERYGFWDSSCTMHTAEIMLEPDELRQAVAGAEPLEGECSRVGGKLLFWVDKVGLDFPLLKLVRRALNSVKTGSKPDREAEALQLVARLIQRHLDRCGDWRSADDSMARRVAEYEQQLLCSKLDDLSEARSKLLDHLARVRARQNG